MYLQHTFRSSLLQTLLLMSSSRAALSGEDCGSLLRRSRSSWNSWQVSEGTQSSVNIFINKTKNLLVLKYDFRVEWIISYCQTMSPWNVQRSCWSKVIMWMIFVSPLFSHSFWSPHDDWEAQGLVSKGEPEQYKPPFLGSGSSQTLNLACSPSQEAGHGVQGCQSPHRPFTRRSRS